MRKLIKSLIVLNTVAVFALAANFATAKANKEQDLIWVDGELYGTVLTPATFKNVPGGKSGKEMLSLDPLFVLPAYMGQRPITTAAPGDVAYNGGRWQVVMLQPTELATMSKIFDMYDNETMAPGPDGHIDTELMSKADITMYIEAGYLTKVYTEMYFACPLIR